MLGIHELWLFIVSGLLLNVTPGPDTAYIIGRSVQLGWRGGAAAALGISAGCLVHVFAAAIGLSALLAASSAAFTLVKWVGAAYLCFMGVKMLLSRPQARADDAVAPSGAISLRQVFLQGALILLRHEFSSFGRRGSGAATWAPRQDFDERVDQAQAHGGNRVRDVAFRPHGQSL